MAKTNQTLAKMRLNPRDWRIEQLKTLADANGVVYRQPGTSPVTFRFPNGTKLTVPAHRPIAPEYIKAFVIEVDRLAIQDSDGLNDDD